MLRKTWLFHLALTFAACFLIVKHTNNAAQGLAKDHEVKSAKHDTGRNDNDKDDKWKDDRNGRDDRDHRHEGRDERHALEGVPRYDHIIVLVEENNGMRIEGNANAPYINSLIKKYGFAARFFGEEHPGSEANYVAMLAGTTNGIHDSGPYYCVPGSPDPDCVAAGSQKPGFHDHTYYGPNLVTQLEEHHISWKGYFQDMPASVFDFLTTTSVPPSLYVTRHNGFLNMRSVQLEPNRAFRRMVGFDKMARDFEKPARDFPGYSMIVGNVCDDMHGVKSTSTAAAVAPPDCYIDTDQNGLIARGDRSVKAIMTMILRSPVWLSNEDVAVVLTYDESDNMQDFTGCCGNDPDDPTNTGAGQVVTVVISNHGVRGVADATPYNHYSLLRTIEDAFGIHEHLNLAGDTADGVKPMAPLFAIKH